MKTTWKWIKKYWYIPLFAAVLLIVMIASRRNPLPRVLAEIRAIDAKERTKKIEAEDGTEAALRDVQTQYKARLRRLDIENQARAASMRNDPVALAAWLERIVAK